MVVQFEGEPKEVDAMGGLPDVFREELTARHRWLIAWSQAHSATLSVAYLVQQTRRRRIPGLG